MILFNVQTVLLICFLSQFIFYGTERRAETSLKTAEIKNFRVRRPEIPLRPQSSAENYVYMISEY